MRDRDQTLLLIDCFALVHRAYHAFPPNLRISDGTLVNAVYGFTSLLLDVLIKFRPSHVVAVFDSAGPTVRHQEYGAYKATRREPDEDFLAQLPLVEKVLLTLDIPLLAVKGFEADDVIGTIDKRHSGAWARTIIVTGDRDLFQLVDDDTFVYLAGSSFSKSQLYDREAVRAKMGIYPEFITDLKGLQGDASDNIPGVYGIGEKGAVSLLQRFGNIENLYTKLDEVENRYRQKLIENQEMAVLSKKLATIITDVPISFDFAQAQFGTFDLDTVQRFIVELEFNSLKGKVDRLLVQALTQPAVKPVQPKKGARGKAPAAGAGNKGAVAGALSLFGSLPEAQVTPWKGKKLTADQVFFFGEFNLAKDPMCWSLQQVYFALDAREQWEVQEKDWHKFFAALGGKGVITNNGKALLHSLINTGIAINFKIFDVSLAAYVYSMGRTKFDLANILSAYHIAVSQTPDGFLRGLIAVYDEQNKEGLKERMLAVLVKMEQELLHIVVDMERSGVTLNVPLVKEFTQKLETEVEQLVSSIYTDVGHEFNISSPKQVGEVLFEEKHLPAKKKTKGGTYSTDERILRELIGVDPVVDKILRYRELTKLISTYLKPLPDFVNPKTGRIHAIFNQLGAVTGRFSSQNPNMQNIPLNDVQGIYLRKAFVAAPGTVWFAFDYSQQELRLLAELSGEEHMKQAFIEKEDIHARTAAEIFGIKPNKITKEQRKVGKTINFGIVYGMSAFGLSDRMKIPKARALEFIETYFGRYPKVKKYYDSLLARARADGYVETIMGRRRSAFDLNSSNYQLRQAVEREIMNFPLQGSAADIIKLAMVKVAPLLKKYPVRLLLQVHDELIFEYETSLSMKALEKDPQCLDFVREVRQTMLGIVQLDVPFEVEVEVGTDWTSMKKFNYVQ